MQVRRNLLLSPDQEWAEEIVRKVTAACHDAGQRDFALDPAKRITALVGRGGGKTTGGVARFIIRMARTPKARCLFIALTKEDAKELIWEKLKDLVERLGIEARFHETNATCTFVRNGSRLRLVGADDTHEIDKLRGKPQHEVGVDEVAAMKPELVENLILRVIGPRLGDWKGCVWMISTPGHFLRGLFYECTRRGSKRHRPYKDRDLEDYKDWKGWSSHHWNLEKAAPLVPAIANLWAEALEEKERNGWGDNHPIWRREYMGEWAADDTTMVYQFKAHAEDGSTWNIWEPERVGPFKLGKLPADRSDWLFVVGADMGHSDPFSLCVLAASPTDPTRTIYHVYEFERPRVYAKVIAEQLLGAELDLERPTGLYKYTGWPAGAVADMTHLGPAILDELAKVYGITFKPAVQKDKFASIELFNGDLIDGRIKVLKDSQLHQQLESLQWKQDEFGRLMEDKSQANHATDAAIYARRILAVLFEREAPPPPTREQRDRAQDDPPPASSAPRRRRNEFEDILGDDFGGELGADDFGLGGDFSF